MYERYRLQSYFLNQVYWPNVKFIYLPISLLLVFGLSDLAHFSEISLLPFAIRVTLCLFMYLATHIMLRRKPKYMESIEVTFLVLASLFLVYVGRFAIEHGYYNYQDGSLLILIYIGTFSRLSLRPSLIALTICFLFYLIGLAPALHDVNPMRQIERYVIYFAAFILILTACFRRELEVKQRFAQFKEIRSQSFKLKAQARRLKSLSYLDPLTKVNNRLYLKESVVRQLESEASTLVMMVDIDHFKQVNDTLGHLIGDEVLIRVAGLLKQNLPSGAHVIRFGGEEFLVVMQNIPQQRAKVVAEQIVHACRQIKEFERPITLSIGAVHSETMTNSLASLIHRADIALYQSKANGRDLVSWCEPVV